MKNVSNKNKFWICFRPVDVDLVGRVPLNSKSKKKTVTCCGVQNQDNMNFPAAKPTVPPNPHRKKTFSQVVKAVVFETVLAKRVHDKKASSYKSTQNSSLDRGDHEVLGSSNRISVQIGNIQESKSLSCSCSTNRGNLMQEIGKNNIVEDRTEIGCPKLSYVIYLLLLSLAATVFWGRVYSIVFTSICLYCFPKIRAERLGDRLEKLRRLPPGRAKKEECREKVIIEGLQQRNYRREGQ